MIMNKKVLEQAANAYIGHEPEIDKNFDIEVLRSAFKAGAEWQKNNIWIKVEEGCDLPHDQTIILVRRCYKKYGRFIIKITQEFYFKHRGFDTYCNKRYNEHITHWMPIPKLP